MEVAWWPCTLRVAMLFLPRLAVMLNATSEMVANSLPFCRPRGTFNVSKLGQRWWM